MTIRNFCNAVKMPVGILLGIAATCIISCGLWLSFPSASDGQTAAAWFQAVGSIGAIIGALWISERQAKFAINSIMTAQSISERAKQKAIFAIAKAANEHAIRIENALAGPDPQLQLYNVYDNTIISGMVGALTAAPIHEIGSRDGVIAYLDLRDQFVFLGQSMEVYLAGPWRHPGLKEALDQYHDPEHHKQLSELVQKCTVMLAENVKRHLARIHSDFEALELSLTGTLAR